MPNQNIWLLRGRERHRQERRAQNTAFLLNLKAGDFILDIGCAEGFVTNHLAHSSFVVGVDISMDSLLAAKEKVKHSDISFIRADTTNLPLKDASFDKVTMLEVLEHLPEETQKKACHEIDRVLKRQGLVVISVPYKEKITYTNCIHRGKLTPLWGHLHSMDKEKVTNLLPSHYALIDSCHLSNVSLISSAGAFSVLPFRLWFLLNNMLGRLHKGYWLILKYEKT